MEKYYSTEDVAEILGFKEKTVREWLRTGRLKGKKVGRLWRVRESDLEEFIKDTKQHSQTPIKSKEEVKADIVTLDK